MSFLSVLFRITAANMFMATVSGDTNSMFNSMSRMDSIQIEIKNMTPQFQPSSMNPIIRARSAGFQPIREQDVADQCIDVGQCDFEAPYRTFSGQCNNKAFPMWGMANSALVRLLPASYNDNDHEIRRAKDGNPLPNARLLSSKLFVDQPAFDMFFTYHFMQWAQFTSHDTTHITTEDRETVDCCPSPSNPTPNVHVCDPIFVPKSDKFYSQFNVTCLRVLRAKTTTDFGCSLQPRQQIVTVSHFIDCSHVYASSKAKADKLRLFQGGRLKVENTGDGDFLPSSDSPADDCDMRNPNDACFTTDGDVRSNQNTGMTAYHVLVAREHNRLCAFLESLNPHWDDETLYQEAKRINTAQVQRITYSEWLEILLGKKFLEQKNFLDNEKGFSNAYERFLNPSSIVAFVGACFRGLHSLLPSKLLIRGENDGCPMTTEIKLSDWFFRPQIVKDRCNYDGMMLGMMMQPQMTMDRFFSQEITNLMFKGQRKFGTDLCAIDINRGRDHGLPPYNDFRVACGLQRANGFEDFLDVMDILHMKQLRELYSSVDDVDLYVAGNLERPMPGAVVGRTYQCILFEQFRRWKLGDRYYFTFGNQAGSFTAGQLKELKKITLARLICDNGNIARITANVFRRPGPTNPFVKCEDIPKMDMGQWKARQDL